jgi:4-aminobutyrate aminotransferase-like enzyme
MVGKLFKAGLLTIPAIYRPDAIEFRPILILEQNEADEITRIVRDTLTAA